MADSTPAEAPKGYRWISLGEMIAGPTRKAFEFDPVRGAYLVKDDDPVPEPERGQEKPCVIIEDLDGVEVKFTHTDGGFCIRTSEQALHAFGLDEIDEVTRAMEEITATHFPDLLLPRTYVRKVAGYQFDGIVLACCSTTRGEVRVVVENGDGMLHIFDPKQLTADPTAKERMEARRASYPDKK